LPEVVSFKPGTPRGLEGEMIEGFANLQRLTLEFVPVATMPEKITALQEGKGDVIVAFVATEQRRKVVDFTADVFPTRHVVLTRLPQPAIRSLEELRRARVGTMKGSSWAEVVTGAQVRPENVDDSFTNPGAVMAALRSGKVSAVVMVLGTALLEKRRDPQLELGLFVGPSSASAWAVRKDAPQLRQALDEYLANLRRTPTWSRLVVKYYGDLALEALQKSRVLSQ
jgi:membrane-bound lytic murein transglycosylase F